MAKSVIIGGADGPTSVCLIKKNPKLTFCQKLQRCRYRIKRHCIEKTIRANNHSIDEVMDYVVNVHGFVEVDSEDIFQEYNEMRASFIMQYASELLGEYATIEPLKSESPEDIQAHVNQFRDRQQRAKEISKEKFDIDFHKFQKPCKDINDNMYIIVEKRFAYIGGGVSGDKKTTKKFQRIYKDVHRYYGVSNKDIENKTKRYEQVIRALTH